MNSDKTTNKIEYTQEEKDLAKKFNVEPRVVRLNPKYFNEQAEESRKTEPEEPETQEQPQGQASDPGEGPKDVNQNTYTEEETSLAAKYQVEPKLIRMIAEIVCEHTTGICELISLYIGKKKQGSEPEQATEPEDAEAGPDTGIKALDDFLERLSYEAQAFAYGALSLVCVSDATGKKMRDYLRRQVALLENPRQVDDLMMDGQVLADIKWFLGFVRGAEIGLEEC